MANGDVRKGRKEMDVLLGAHRVRGQRLSQTTKQWVVGGGQGIGHTVKLKEWLDDYVGRLIDCSS